MRAPERASIGRVALERAAWPIALAALVGCAHRLPGDPRAPFVRGASVQAHETTASASSVLPAASSASAPAGGHGDPGLRAVLVAIDGARWQDLFGGPDPGMLEHDGEARYGATTARDLTPNLHALMDRGVAFGDQENHSQFDASGPNFVSLPGYIEMLTGRTSACERNDCITRPDETLADVFRHMPGVKNEDVAVFASWETIAMIAAHDQMRVVVSCGRNHGDTRFDLGGDVVVESLADVASRSSSRPGGGDYRPDGLTGPLAVEYFARVRPRFMFLSLGDTDEYGHAGAYGEYLGALHRADGIIGELVRVADGWGDEARRVLWFVTADHGRGDDFCDHGKFCPESQGSWLVAAGGTIPARGALSWTRPHYLRDIAPTIRALVGAPLEARDDAGVPMTEMLP